MNIVNILFATILVIFSTITNATDTGEAQQQFNFISELNGDWKLSPVSVQEGKTTQHKAVKPLIGTNRVAMSFKVIGKGSTVQENLLPGTKKEMATMYHCDKFGKCGEVLATHYCAKRNQPKMVAAPGLSYNSVTLNCDMDSPICQSNAGHVHKISHKLSNNGSHLKTTYTIFKNGKYKKDSIYHFDRIMRVSSLP